MKQGRQPWIALLGAFLLCCPCEPADMEITPQLCPPYLYD